MGKRLYSPLLMNEFSFKFFEIYEEMKNAVNILKIMTNKVLFKAKHDNTRDQFKHKCKHLIDIVLGDKINDEQIASAIDTFILAASIFYYHE